MFYGTVVCCFHICDDFPCPQHGTTHPVPRGWTQLFWRFCVSDNVRDGAPARRDSNDTIECSVHARIMMTLIRPPHPSLPPAELRSGRLSAGRRVPRTLAQPPRCAEHSTCQRQNPLVYLCARQFCYALQNLHLPVAIMAGRRHDTIWHRRLLSGDRPSSHSAVLAGRVATVGGAWIVAALSLQAILLPFARGDRCNRRLLATRRDRLVLKTPQRDGAIRSRCCAELHCTAVPSRNEVTPTTTSSRSHIHSQHACDIIQASVL